MRGGGGGEGDAFEWKGPRRRPQRRLGRRLEGVAKAVGGGYCRLQMPLKLALGVRGTVAGHRLGALGNPPPLPMHPWRGGGGGSGGCVQLHAENSPPGLPRALAAQRPPYPLDPAHTLWPACSRNT